MTTDSIRHFIVGTAGHVDHGKSTLVRALTGTDPDRLPEEKARGITIDLGFAHLALPGMELGLVDVPGHEDFVKNMVAGVGAVDLALFVVAADDGWMPQTEEHLQILTYLGVRRAVVALTKIDLAADEETVVAAVRARLQDSPFADASIVPTAVTAGRGILELRAALAAALADAPPPPDLGKPRLPVDRVFALRGVGTVVTGTLTGGTLSRGQAVVVQPSGRAGHVRSVQNHGRETDAAAPGTRTAVNLPELTAGGEFALTRGEVVTLPELGGASRTLDVVLSCLARARPPSGTTVHSPTLPNGKTLRLHLGSGHWTARVNLLDHGELAPGEKRLARLRCDRPVFACAGDRFVLRDGAGRRTVAGGVVLDPEADRRRRFRRVPQRRFLRDMEAALEANDPAVALLAALARDHALPKTTLLPRGAFSVSQMHIAVSRLVEEGRAVAAGNLIVDTAWWTNLRARAAALVDARHREAPERIGLSLARLSAALTKLLPVPVLLDELVRALTSPGDFVQVGASLRRANHQPTLPAHLQAAGARLRAELARQPFEPPGRQALAPDGPSRQALRFLFDTGEALELGEDVVLLETSFRRMRAIITRTLRALGPSTTSDLRQVLGTTRRVLIPVLEHLDREGVTRREGDRRALR